MRIFLGYISLRQHLLSILPPQFFVVDIGVIIPHLPILTWPRVAVYLRKQRGFATWSESLKTCFPQRCDILPPLLWLGLPSFFISSSAATLKLKWWLWQGNFLVQIRLYLFQWLIFFILVNIHLAALHSRTNDYNFVSNKGGDKYCNYVKYKSNHLIK